MHSYRASTLGGFSTCSCCSTRRGFLASAAGVAASAVLPSFGAAAQQSAGGPRYVDVHHHIYPPDYTRENYQRLVDDAPTFPGQRYLSWTPEVSIELMDKAGVATSMASITSPGVWFGDNAEGRRWARVCNEYGAKVIQKFPGRFGMFAAIPLPDTEGSLAEIAYALDILKLDGIGLLTSYNGRLLGDPGFAPVIDELNRRKAVVFVHPTMSCCGNTSIPHVNNPALEFPFDTTRTITSLLFTGTFGRCPDIRFIFSHGGGATPMLLQRISGTINNLTDEERKKLIPHGVEAEVARQFYDLASIALNPAGMAAVFEAIPKSQLMYGSDQPFGSLSRIAAAIEKLPITAAERREIARENAERLFPRLKA